MTRYERIMQEMTVEQLAELLTEATESKDTWYDMTVISYHNEAGDFYMYDEAIRAEIEYLNGVDA